ncbi:DNA recombination protein RmuC [Sandaracinobacteroides saxicola]|uniref:DNA recombination protein RmuC homolog n=1 Tax=Sandaracinobacteroides saxicola TaxID=2759707 RepID=A0A7G5IFE1_9SPHN|nr:DNA recombination protein RmuC [Sandaracinobacteroides saxicola]QMW22083.1 DNA recombination protein RmuC [Sandaracinobacteroides saxicola]
MLDPVALAIAVAALLIAAGLAWVLRGRDLATLRTERDAARTESARWQAEAATHATALAALQATQAERDAAHARQLLAMKTEFQQLAGDALAAAQTRFNAQAEETLKRHREETGQNIASSRAELAKLLTPVSETLTRYQTELKSIEEARVHAYGGLRQQLADVAQGQAAVRDEAARLATALRSSGKTAGRWGEEQLQRTLELGGLRLGIDFTLQTSQAGDDGRQRRPDAIINLPGGRELVIDSKCSLNDYLTAAGATSDEERRAALARHAAAFRAHAQGLALKSYWSEFAASADFVIMFIPGENFLSAALETDLDLLGWAMDRRVILTGPTNLLALARTVSMVWKQETLARQAAEIGEEAGRLYAAISTMAEHVQKLGRNLTQSVGNYNDFVASLERNVLPKARRLPDMGVETGKKDLPETKLIEATLRPPTAPELLPPPAE